MSPFIHVKNRYNSAFERVIKHVNVYTFIKNIQTSLTHIRFIILPTYVKQITELFLYIFLIFLKF